MGSDLPPAKRSKGIDYTGVCVVFACHDGQGRYVMDKRSMKARDEQGTWEFGGGGLEFGEQVEDMVRKEVLEEIGADVMSMEFLGYRDVHRNPGGVKTHWIGLDFRVLVDPSQVRNREPDKFDDVAWFTVQEIVAMDNLQSQMQYFMNKYCEQLV